MKNIKLDGAKNVRDLHEVDSSIKEYVLLRGQSLDNLTDKDIDILVNEYNLKTIIDLRTDREADDLSDVEIAKVKYYHMPIFNESTPGISHEDDSNLLKRNIDVTKIHEVLLEDKCINNISKIIKKIISIGNGAILFHCTEGKDRTGIISLIILSLLGINKELIIKDYLYTNKVNKKKANKLYFKYKYLKHDKKRAERLRDVFLAKEEYINAVFDTIDTVWNGFDNFAKKGLKITDKEIEDFRKRALYV